MNNHSADVVTPGTTLDTAPSKSVKSFPLLSEPRASAPKQIEPSADVLREEKSSNNSLHVESNVPTIESDIPMSIPVDWTPEVASEDQKLIDEIINCYVNSEQGSGDARLSKLQNKFVEQHAGRNYSSPLNKLGLRELNHKKFERAARCFASAIQDDPDNAMLYSNLGFAQTLCGRLSSGQQNLLQSIALASNREMAWNDLGVNYAKNHMQHKAVGCFLVAVKLSDGKSREYLKSLDKDEDVAVRLAARKAFDQSQN